MFRSLLGKTLGFVGYTIQYGCIAHCAFEYIGEFVVVCIPIISHNQLYCVLKMIAF